MNRCMSLCVAYTVYSVNKALENGAYHPQSNLHCTTTPAEQRSHAETPLLLSYDCRDNNKSPDGIQKSTVESIAVKKIPREQREKHVTTRLAKVAISQGDFSTLDGKEEES